VASGYGVRAAHPEDNRRHAAEALSIREARGAIRGAAPVPLGRDHPERTAV